jgi:AcrR family transcriptional regulator
LTDSIESPDTRLRADAQQNRRHIIEVARDALAASPGASLNSIAKAAGVGAGTLYRHFPNREALVLAVYRHEIDQMVALAPKLLDQHPPLIALRLWFDRLAHYGRMKQGVAEVLHAAMTPTVTGATYGPMVDAIEQLLKAGETSGDIRLGVDAEDLLLLMGFLWRIEPSPDAEGRADRLLDLVMAGLQVRSESSASAAVKTKKRT